MTSARKAFANRINGERGYAARSAAGKARQAEMARRHGLALPVLLDPALAPEVDALAREIAVSVAGRPVDDAGHALACRIAEAMIDLYRVRRAKRPLSAALDANPSSAATLKALARLDRYEQRALARAQVREPRIPRRHRRRQSGGTAAQGALLGPQARAGFWQQTLTGITAMISRPIYERGH